MVGRLYMEIGVKTEVVNTYVNTEESSIGRGDAPDKFNKLETVEELKEKVIMARST
jgi:hypothetical protein